MIKRNGLFFIGCIALLCCKDPAKVNRDKQKIADKVRDTVITDSISIESESFNADLLTGKWTIDIDSLKKRSDQVCKNTKRGSFFYFKDANKFKHLTIKFNKDGTFEVNASGKNAISRWGMSSDGSSYWIRMADDFIELHGIKSLSGNKLIEYPVAQWKVAQLRLKKLYLTGGKQLFSVLVSPQMQTCICAIRRPLA